jgi:hypothetical protein
MAASEVNLVQQWHTSLNEGAVDAMVALVDEAVEIVGPRGITQGADVVREWFGRANVRLIPLQYFHRGDTIVVEECGEWLSLETGEITGSQVVTTVFVVHNNLITRIARYDTLQTALTEGGLSETDKIG